MKGRPISGYKVLSVEPIYLNLSYITSSYTVSFMFSIHTKSDRLHFVRHYQDTKEIKATLQKKKLKIDVIYPNDKILLNYHKGCVWRVYNNLGNKV